MAHRGFSLPNVPANIFDASCLPWFALTGAQIIVPNDEPYLAPILTWGQYKLENGQLLLPLSFQIHHAAADGFHISRFYKELAQKTQQLAAHLQ